MVLDGGPSVYDAMVMVQVIVPFLQFLQENADLIWKYRLHTTVKNCRCAQDGRLELSVGGGQPAPQNGTMSATVAVFNSSLLRDC